uniref:Galectin n=1 Tax=Onchocerca volvulus TaxID=6282 RepID=A0A8R1Y7B3_ONCVO
MEEQDGEKKFKLPYRSKLTERIAPGQTLIVKGKTLKDAKKLDVGLHRDSPDYSGGDIPLYISICFRKGKISFNTFSDNNWGKKEKQKVPFKRGKAFDLRIRAHGSKFVIYCDGKEVKLYDYRVPLQWVTYVSIDGDAVIDHVQWGGKYYPVPYESGIVDGGLLPGKSLHITGMPDKRSKRFNINLLKQNGDIALHFNPRFDEKVVVRNALIGGVWGKEERGGKLPFEKDRMFDLQFQNEDSAIQIFVNGQRFATFSHRAQSSDILGVQIQGDLEISGIQIQ